MLGVVTVRKRINGSYSDTSENRQMISPVVAVPGIFLPRREIRQLISRTETVARPFSLRGSYSLPWKGARMIGRRQYESRGSEATKHLQMLI